MQESSGSVKPSLLLQFKDISHSKSWLNAKQPTNAWIFLLNEHHIYLQAWDSINIFGKTG